MIRNSTRTYKSNKIYVSVLVVCFLKKYSIGFTLGPINNCKQQLLFSIFVVLSTKLQGDLNHKSVLVHKRYTYIFITDYNNFINTIRIMLCVNVC